MWNDWRAATDVLPHFPIGVWASKCMVAVRAILRFLATLTMPGALAAEPDWTDYLSFCNGHLSRRTVSGVRLAWLDYRRLRTVPAWADRGPARNPEKKLAFCRQEFFAWTPAVLHFAEPFPVGREEVMHRIHASNVAAAPEL